ncbi:MAG TPA: hypothetical protein VFD30_12915 [Terriglobia bacterium]|nr:hypothetical protein [Terriglobia bacterium]
MHPNVRSHIRAFLDELRILCGRYEIVIMGARITCDAVPCSFDQLYVLGGGEASCRGDHLANRVPPERITVGPAYEQIR